MFKYESWRTDTNRKGAGNIPVVRHQILEECIERTFDYLGFYEPFVVVNEQGVIEYQTYGGITMPPAPVSLTNNSKEKRND